MKLPMIMVKLTRAGENGNSDSRFMVDPRAVVCISDVFTMGSVVQGACMIELANGHTAAIRGDIEDVAEKLGMLR